MEEWEVGNSNWKGCSIWAISSFSSVPELEDSKLWGKDNSNGQLSVLLFSHSDFYPKTENSAARVNRKQMAPPSAVVGVAIWSGVQGVLCSALTLFLQPWCSQLGAYQWLALGGMELIDSHSIKSSKTKIPVWCILGPALPIQWKSGVARRCRNVFARVDGRCCSCASSCCVSKPQQQEREWAGLTS